MARTLLACVLLLVGCQTQVSVSTPSSTIAQSQTSTALPQAAPGQPPPSITSPTATESPTLTPTMEVLPLTLERVSLASDGAQANGFSTGPGISDDGRYVVYISWASNLVLDDTNQCIQLSGEAWNCPDIFVYDRLTGETERVSVAGDGTQANAESGAGYEFTLSRPAISADGHWIAFGSFASNLVAEDTNDSPDVFVYDRQTQQIKRISVAHDGTQANRGSDFPNLSADGRYLAFVSSASNLVADDTNNRCSPFEEGQPTNCPDVFVYDLQTRQIERISLASDGTQGNSRSGDFSTPSLSADGRYVAFVSWATNLVSDDTNNLPDIFVHDRLTGTTERVSVNSAGEQTNGESMSSVLSADGRWVTFVSQADNLVAQDTNGYPDIFVHDRQTGKTEQISIASDGAQANGESSGPRISADGRWIVFSSQASNLVANDTNNQSDVFVHDQQSGRTERVSITRHGAQANGSSGPVSLSADGRWIAFVSSASNLIADDTNELPDIFVRDWMAK